MANKTYLEMANERHELNKHEKAERLAIELAKIRSQEKRQTQRLNHATKQQRNKHTHALINIISGLISFIVILLILYGFSMLISQ